MRSGGGGGGAPLDGPGPAHASSPIGAMFIVSSSDGDARSGEVSTPSGAISTPGLLAYTHRGGSMNLTPDLLEPLRAAGLQGLQLDALQL